MFSRTLPGPVFFEFIQPKNGEGFGAGKLAWLFESMQCNPMRRGAIQAEV
jgi:4-hydroxyphenylpyruvate dioxygenase